MGFGIIDAIALRFKGEVVMSRNVIHTRITSAVLLRREMLTDRSLLPLSLNVQAL